MSNTPIIIVAGKAGSGKDTVANHIAQNYNGITIAQADPMKRFVKNLLGFTTETLWGPSELRNAQVPYDQLTHHLNFSEFSREAGVFLDELRLTTEAAGRSLWHWYVTNVHSVLVSTRSVSARTVLQTLGTEWGRGLSPRMWVELAKDNCRTLLEGGYTYDREKGLVPDAERAYDYAIISDGRFRNEILGVSMVGGVSLHIHRPRPGEVGPGIAGHRSEKELDSIPKHFYTETILNDSTLEALFDRVDDEMAIHFGDTTR